MTNHLATSAKRASCSTLSSMTALLALTTALQAQCGNEAVPGFPHLGPSGPVDAMCYWDPDGQGPRGQQLFVGGRMDFVERTPCNGAALYDPIAQTWSALPVGVFDQVHAATVDSTGLLILAGSFGSGPTLQYRVASFDGNSLTVLGSAFDGPILTAAPHGSNLIVGGSFTQNGGQPLASLAQWNGTTWSDVGGGVSSPGTATITALCTMTNGDLAVGGTFAAAGSTTAANIAHWNGTSWQAFGSGLPAEVTAIATFSTGELFAAGLNQGAPSQWDGANWNPLTGLNPAVGQSNPWVSALAVSPGFAGEELILLGSFRLSNGSGDLASWDPQFGWSYTIAPLEGIQTAPPTRMPLAPSPSPSGPGSQSYAIAGPFVAAGGRSCSGAAIVASYAYAVDPLGAGINNAVAACTSLPNGDLLIGGRFAQIDRSDAPALAISTSNGDHWQAPSIGGYPAITAAADVRTIVTTPDGGYLIGGSFTVGYAAGTDITYFDGSNWLGFGPSPFSYGANAVVQHTDGTIYCGGNGVYRRDGSVWTLLSTVASGIGATCFTLSELANGDLVVGGDLQTIPGGVRPGVLRWDGSSWQPLGAGLASVAPPGNLLVAASCVGDDGVLWVVGTAGSVAFAANFDGTAWQLLPGPVNGNLQAITVLPDGDIVVGGEFSSIAGVAANSIARFDGTAWHAIGDGVKQIDGQPGKVLGLHFGIEGDLHIGGEFARHDGEVSINFTRLRSLCPSLTQSFAAGCSGSGGQNKLRREIGAWLGGTMRNVATGLPQNGLAIEVLGLATAYAPLPTTGCTLWVRPDLLAVLLPVAGTVTTQAAIPDSPTLIGQVLYQQIVGVEVVGSTIAGFTGSNRLQHTIGVF